MATVVRENIGLLNDKLVVKLNKTDYLPSFEKALKGYSKNANIPGFRKGMVPAGMIKKMYGNSVFTDEIVRNVEKELHNWLNTEKPDIFAQPLPLDFDVRQLDMNNPADYEFGFEIGLKPEFTLPDLSKAAFTLHKVSATPEMVEEEVKRMQIKGGKMTEPEIVDNDENVLNIQFRQCTADGTLIEGGIEKENSVLLKYFTTPLQKQLMGKKKDDTIVFQLAQSFDGKELDAILQDLGFAKDDSSASQQFFEMTIVKVGLVEKRELTEEFFNEIYPGKGITTEAELRTQLQEEIQQYWDGQSRNQLHDQLYHHLLDNTTMEFPAGFLKRWLQTGGEKPKSAEEAEAEYPIFSNQLKWTLISDKLIQSNNLQVGQDELREYMRVDIMRYFGSMGMGSDTTWIDAYIDRMLKDEKQVDSTYRRLVTEKLFNWAAAQTHPVEKTVTPEELGAMQHNHQH